MKRITTIVGAGAVLDLPAGIMRPSTKNITDSVRELRKKNILSGKDIIEIEEIYQILEMVQEIIGNKISNDLAVFLCRMTGKSAARFAMESFVYYDNVGPMVSENGCLMMFTGGFKAASTYRREIYEFLNS